MRKPSRPGEMLRDMFEEMGLSVTEAAAHLGVTRQTLNNLVNNERASVSPEMAVRLSYVFGSTPEFWLRLQANYDAAAAREKEPEISKGLKRYRPEPA